MTQPETTWAVLWTTGIDPVHPNETPTREWEEYDTEAEANAMYNRLREIRQHEIGWSREGGQYHPEWAITVYEPVAVVAGWRDRGVIDGRSKAVTA
jgi:hypothetical protein